VPDNTRQEVIISLDFLSNAYALEVANQAANRVWGFRINEFIYHYGSSAIYELKNYGRVFADIKIHDTLKNTKAILQTMQAAGADLVSVYYNSELNPSDYHMALAVVDSDELTYSYHFDTPDMLKGSDENLKIIHAHLFDPVELSAKLVTGAFDDKSVGKKEM